MSAVASEVINGEPVIRRDNNGVTTLTLNRPDQYNALSCATMDALQSHLDDISKESAVRIVVIEGNGKAFCAGHDLKEIRAVHTQEAHRSLFSQCSKVMLTITRLRQPVIAKVHGIATAAGCQLVATCDLAIASEAAKFATSGVNLGLFCSTPAVALSRNMNRKDAMEMLLTGDFIDAQTALSKGLVNRVVPADQLDAAIEELVQKICAKSAVAISAGKSMFYRQIEMSMENAYAYTSDVMAWNLASADAVEGIDAFMQKRTPIWEDR